MIMPEPSYSSELKYRVEWLLSTSRHDTVMLLCVAAILLSIGFVVGTGDNPNYAMIYSFGGNIFWGLLFIGYAMILMCSLLFNIPRWLYILNGVIGLWAWNFIFLSFVIFDTSPITPTEILLLIPTLAECWVLLGLQLKQKEKPKESIT